MKWFSHKHIFDDCILLTLVRIFRFRSFWRRTYFKYCKKELLYSNFLFPRALFTFLYSIIWYPRPYMKSIGPKQAIWCPITLYTVQNLHDSLHLWSPKIQHLVSPSSGCNSNNLQATAELYIYKSKKVTSICHHQTANWCFPSGPCSKKVLKQHQGWCTLHVVSHKKIVCVVNLLYG